MSDSRNKKAQRMRRAARARAKIRELNVVRLAVHRTPRHIYAQIIAADGGHVLVTASTVQEGVRAGLKGTGNVDAAKAVGKAIAERAKAAGIEQVAFDRSGFKYHGRVKALADAAREHGLKF
jgi:large subunit ribosomal protein L18